MMKESNGWNYYDDWKINSGGLIVSIVGFAKLNNVNEN